MDTLKPDTRRYTRTRIHTVHFIYKIVNLENGLINPTLSMQLSAMHVIASYEHEVR